MRGQLARHARCRVDSTLLEKGRACVKQLNHEMQDTSHVAWHRWGGRCAAAKDSRESSCARVIATCVNRGASCTQAGESAPSSFSTA